MNKKEETVNHHRIAIIGLGYVGLPLARLFATKYPVIGYDINKARIEELNKGHDSTLEVEDEMLRAVLVKNLPTLLHNNHQEIGPIGLYCTTERMDIALCNTYIVTVPTPIDENNSPDLTHLRKASKTVGEAMKRGDIVIYESTVYPGATEEECIPILERVSGLKYKEEFSVGYSPERINPGDKEHTVDKILKVTSGSSPEAAQTIDALYRSVISRGTHMASSIMVAEAAKVIENAQRDINIAFVNELAKIFNGMGIDTQAVLEAAGTKWNFLPFRPGLVGGHCIGVDPYYLAQKAQAMGYHPEIILAGRRLNNTMGQYVASQVVKGMIKRDIKINGAEILQLGITFKENCPDIRNTGAIKVYEGLLEYGISVDIYDPWADSTVVKREYGIDIHNSLPFGKSYDAIVLTVAHREYTGLDLNKLKADNCFVYDVKGVLAEYDERL